MKKLFIIITAVIVCLMPFGNLAGAASPSGKITVIMINKADKNPLPDKETDILKIADCSYSTNNISFTLIGDFAYSDVNLSDTDAASKLYNIALASGYKSTAVYTDSEGKAQLPCALGAYLVTSPDNLFNPFIVFVPYETKEEVIFDVTAMPKIDITEPEPTEPDTSEPDTSEPDTSEPDTTEPTSSGNPVIHTTTTSPYPNTPGSSNNTNTTASPVIPVAPFPVVPYVPGDRTITPHTTVPRGEKVTNEETTSVNKPEKLPQTGMIQYPIPILGFAGVLMFAIGFIIYGEGKKKEN